MSRAERLDALVVRILERAVATHHVGNLPDEQPQVALARCGCPRTAAAARRSPGGAGGCLRSVRTKGSGTRPWTRRWSSSSSMCMSTASASSGCARVSSGARRLRAIRSRGGRAGRHGRRTLANRSCPGHHTTESLASIDPAHAARIGHIMTYANPDDRVRSCAVCENGRSGGRDWRAPAWRWRAWVMTSTS